MNESTAVRKVLSLQPFYGGSHKQFIDDWMGHSRHQWHQETLPERFWKWRMRHAAVEFSGRVDSMWQAGDRWDAIVATDMLNAAEFRGLLKSAARKLPLLVYFHENQFEYPSSSHEPRDFHFAFTNLTSALAADEVWFNSQFNLDSMVRHLEKLMGEWPDYQPVDAIDKLVAKSKVKYPGIGTDCLIDCKTDRIANRKTDRMHVVWAGRWEHDKNPELLLQILTHLDELGVEFELSVIGRVYRQKPEAFSLIQEKFEDRIVHWGYQESRAAYLSVLQSANLILSTADHEFFGVSVAEAIACGCVPVLPNRLAYPELIDVAKWPDRRQLLFETASEAAIIIDRIAKKKVASEWIEPLAAEFVNKFGWENRVSQLDSGIESLVGDDDTE